MHSPSTTTTSVFAEVASAAREHSLGQRAVRTDRTKGRMEPHNGEVEHPVAHERITQWQRELPQLTDTATTARCSERGKCRFV